jgi:hypothetical protein
MMFWVSSIMALAMVIEHRRLSVARGLCGPPETRDLHFGLDRLHQLVGDEHLAADIPLRRGTGAVTEHAKLRRGVQVIGAEIACGDQFPMMQLHANGFLPHAVLEDAGGGIVLPDLVVEARENAGQVFGEKRPHLPQKGQRRPVDLKQIEADGVPIGGHGRLRRRGMAVRLFKMPRVNGVRISA